MQKKCYLAVDLGAESGRVVAGLFDGRTLELKEVHRFWNGPVAVRDHLYWDALGLFREIGGGLKKACAEFKDAASVGVDTWGVDYGFVDDRGELLGNPYHYRDPRTELMMESVFRRIPREKVYELTGIQFMRFNTLYQLQAELAGNASGPALAGRFLMMPDLLNYWLTGCPANERTIASTTQMLNPRTGAWAPEILRPLGLPQRAFGPITEPGTIIGRLLPGMAAQVGADLPVVAVGSHDTASAVAAVPLTSPHSAYLSSGTWSLLGIETQAPVINAASYRHGFTNEAGVCGTIRLLKNIAGLWLVQECRRAWAAAGEEHDYAGLTRMAAAAKPFASRLDPDDPQFSVAGGMPEKIAAHCRAAGQPVPADKGSMVRTVLESLARRYREVLAMAEELGGFTVDRVHIVGGGSQNSLLNQLASDATNRPVVAGPVEATAAGNILVQMLALKDIASLAEGRDIIRESFPVNVYEPKDAARWEA